jgi:hypothetical protein
MIGAWSGLVWFVGVVKKLCVACQSPVVCAGEKQFKVQRCAGFLTVHAQSLQRLQALHTEEFKSVKADEPV